MKMHGQHIDLALAADRPVGLRGARGALLVGETGRAWITAEGAAGDLFLGPGETYRIPGDGLVLIEGLGDARVVLMPPDRPGCRILPLRNGGWVGYCG